MSVVQVSCAPKGTVCDVYRLTTGNTSISSPTGRHGGGGGLFSFGPQDNGDGCYAVTNSNDRCLSDGDSWLNFQCPVNQDPSNPCSYCCSNSCHYDHSERQYNYYFDPSHFGNFKYYTCDPQPPPSFPCFPSDATVEVRPWLCTTMHAHSMTLTRDALTPS